MIALVPLLVIRTAPVKPVFHSLPTTYWHLLPLTALLLDDELFMDELLLVATELELLLVATELELLDLTLLDVEVELEDELELTALDDELEDAPPTIP